MWERKSKCIYRESLVTEGWVACSTKRDSHVVTEMHFFSSFRNFFSLTIFKGGKIHICNKRKPSACHVSHEKLQYSLKICHKNYLKVFSFSQLFVNIWVIEIFVSIKPDTNKGKPQKPHSLSFIIPNTILHISYSQKKFFHFCSFVLIPITL